jgi:hypothetical protein
MNVGARSPHPDWKTPHPFKVLTSKPLTPTKWDSKIIDLGAYPTTCTIIVQDPLGNALNLGAYPTTCTIIVWDPLGNALNLGPYPTTCTIIVRDALGNALNLGPYPTKCTILVQDPLERLEMPSTLGLTILHVLSLCGTHLRVWKCPWSWALPYYKYYLCVGPIRGFGNALDCGPYPTTCTILVQDPLERLEMPSTLGLTLLHVLSLGGIGNAAFDIVPYPTTTWYYPCARPSRGFGNPFDPKP